MRKLLALVCVVTIVTPSINSLAAEASLYALACPEGCGGTVSITETYREFINVTREPCSIDSTKMDSIYTYRVYTTYECNTCEYSDTPNHEEIEKNCGH